MCVLEPEGCQKDHAGTRLDHTNSTLSAGELSRSQRIKITLNSAQPQSTPGTVSDWKSNLVKTKVFFYPPAARETWSGFCDLFRALIYHWGETEIGFTSLSNRSKLPYYLPHFQILKDMDTIPKIQTFLFWRCCHRLCPVSCSEKVQSFIFHFGEKVVNPLYLTLVL